MRSVASYATALLGFVAASNALDLNLDDETSVKTTLATIAYDMMTYYDGNTTGKTPGLLPGPCQSVDCYYWWTAGGMWASLINYYQYTGDSSYNPTVIQALQFQKGPDANYNPPNQSKNMGIDDQAFWGFAAMEAVEAGIPDVEGQPSWLTLAENVFNFQTALWDAETCDGGFRWQVYAFNAGYNLKNLISNGAFFSLASRLARYTGNQTYADWAVKVYDWIDQSALVAENNNTLYLWDSTDVSNGCIDAEQYVWTYNYGSLLLGSAMMYNFTNGDDTWQSRIDSILNGAVALFFPNGNRILTEVTCEDPGNCNNDQRTFKAYTARWMAVTTQVAPYTSGIIMPLLRQSAQGAAGQCVGGSDERLCGSSWNSTTWDGSEGVGQQMSALAVIGATQIRANIAPLTAATGGSSGNGTSSNSDNPSGSPNNDTREGTAGMSTGESARKAVMIVVGSCMLGWAMLL